MAESSSSGAAKEEEEESGLSNAADAVPFMLYVLIVFVITWLLLQVTFNGFVVFACLIGFLVQVERRARKKLRSEIASEERRKLNTKRTFDEGETSRWLNEGIKRMWPVCMEKFASKHFFGPMAPYFLNKFKPWIVKEAKIDIETLNLGTTPPVFNSIRALERPPDGDHLAYEADMDFYSSNDMYAEMSVVMRGRLSTTFHISNLHIEGKVRITVKFLTGWPVVGRVRICFASTPEVNMTYRPYYRNFPDASLMPGVENLVRKTLHNAMVESIVEPHMLDVNIEALASMLSSASQGAPATYVSEEVSKPTLVVEILEATDLISADLNGKSDPYVEIQFRRQKKRTKIIKKNLNPKWKDEQHEFSIENWDMSNFLTLRVRDSDVVPYRPSVELGILTVSVNELYKDGELDEDGKPYEFGKRYVFDRRLDKVKKGHLRFAITVNHTQVPAPAFEEPRISDDVRQTVTPENKLENTQGNTQEDIQENTQQPVTQEIQSAVDYVVYDSPVRGTSTEMKRCKSDTNLHKLDRTPPKRPKGKSKLPHHTATHDSPLEALQEQTTSDESHDIVTMPYGPPGAFKIFHPGWAQAPVATPPRKKTHAQPIPNSIMLVDEQVAEVLAKQPTLQRYLARILPKRRKPSQESVPTETMSDKSGSLETVEFTTEELNFFKNSLEDLTKNYSGPVRMNLDESIASGEPPEMLIHGSGPLETIVSGKTASIAQASNSHSIQAPRNDTATDEEETTTSQPLGEVDKAGPPSGRLIVPIAESKLDEEARRDDNIASPQPQLGGSLRRPQTGKKIFSVPKTWYKKVKSLAAKGGSKKKKMKDVNGVAHSAELKYPSGDDGEGFPDEVDPTAWRTDSFNALGLSPLDTVKHGSAPGSVQGDSPELRKLIYETPHSRAAGSKSDRPTPSSKLKQWIQNKSFRLRGITFEAEAANTPLNYTPESGAPGSVQHRNGKVSV
ncbi:hypothetical protein KC19_10G123500 [Ceratodon purpureus]|uniref:C2 domain-containing protein n=1 Tax=Ceratodon purpureus TaxID=3225 RepID=A0A8T0GN77_CERPU|nr:hypothetical protein KC19_10G123500 [Ceratodon purpureus]